MKVSDEFCYPAAVLYEQLFYLLHYLDSLKVYHIHCECLLIQGCHFCGCTFLCVCFFFCKSLTLHFMYSVIDVRPTLSAHLENWKSQQVNAVNLDENIKDKLMSWNTLSDPLSVSFSSKILYKDRPLTSFLSMSSILLFRHSRRLQGKRITEVWL